MILSIFSLNLSLLQCGFSNRIFRLSTFSAVNWLLFNMLSAWLLEHRRRSVEKAGWWQAAAFKLLLISSYKRLFCGNMCKLLMHVLRLKAAALVNDHTECLVVCLKALLLPFAAVCCRLQFSVFMGADYLHFVPFASNWSTSWKLIVIAAQKLLEIWNGSNRINIPKRSDNIET